MLWRVLRPEKFIGYRARLHTAEGMPLLAGRKLSMYDWTHFEPRELEPRNLIKRFIIRSRIDDKSIEVEGTRDGINYVPVTRWLFLKWRDAEIRARAEEEAGQRQERRQELMSERATESVEDLGKRMEGIRKRCRPEPKMGEAAHHVAVCREKGEGNVVEALKLAGYDGVREENVPDLVKNGARRISREHKECVFCKYERAGG